MQLVLVSGLSGSGKSIALNVLEDGGYYCVDNLPANLLMETVDFLAEAGHDRAAVSIDARSAALPTLPQHIEELRARGVDCRMLANPHYDPQLRPFTGCDAPVIEYLKRDAQVARWLEDVQRLLKHWLPEIVRENRSHVTVAIGCTGGRHRSVYLAEELAKAFRADWRVLVRHRALADENP